MRTLASAIAQHEQLTRAQRAQGENQYRIKIEACEKLARQGCGSTIWNLSDHCRSPFSSRTLMLRFEGTRISGSWIQ